MTLEEEMMQKQMMQDRMMQDRMMKKKAEEEMAIKYGIPNAGDNQVISQRDFQELPEERRKRLEDAQKRIGSIRNLPNNPMIPPVASPVLSDQEQMMKDKTMRDLMWQKKMWQDQRTQPPNQFQNYNYASIPPQRGQGMGLLYKPVAPKKGYAYVYNQQNGVRMGVPYDKINDYISQKRSNKIPYNPIKYR